MAYTPFCPSPYMTTIDLDNEEKHTFSCMLNPRDKIVGYSFNIKKVSDGTVVDELKRYQCYDKGVYGNGDNNVLNIDLVIGSEDSEVKYNNEDYTWNVNLIEDVYTDCYYGYYRGDDKTSNIRISQNTDDMSTYARTDCTGCVLQIKDERRIIVGFDSHDHVIPDEPFSSEILEWAYDNEKSNKVQLFENVSKSPEYYFKARDKAVITFDIPETIHSSIVDIGVDYQQEQNIKPAYYCFNLYQGAELVDTTGNIFSANIKYYYDGLINGVDYSLELKILDDEKREIIISKGFSVEYDDLKSLIEPVVYVDNFDNCINVDFSQYVRIDGVIENENFDIPDLIFKKFKTDKLVPNRSNGISLQSGQNLYWNKRNENKELDLEDTEQLLHWHGHKGFCDLIIQKIDETNLKRDVRVGFDGQNFYYFFGFQQGIFVNQGSSFPYTNIKNAISFTEVSNVDENTFYGISDNDTILDSDFIIENDLINKYWWLILIKQNGIEIQKSTKYTDTVVE